MLNRPKKRHKTQQIQGFNQMRMSLYVTPTPPHLQPECNGDKPCAHLKNAGFEDFEGFLGC